VTERNDRQDIQDRFAQLQKEVHRVAAPPTTDETVVFEEASPQLTQIARRTEEGTAALARAVEVNRQAIEDLTVQMQLLCRRQPGRWRVPMAIIFGAAMIAAAVLVSDPGRIGRLIGEFTVNVFPSKPHAKSIEPEPALAQALPPPGTKTANESTTISTPALPAPASGVVVPAQPLAAPPPAPAEIAAASLQTVPPVAAMSEGAPAAPAAVDPAKAHGGIVLRAKAESWVKVRDRSGQVLLQRVLHAGDTWSVPDQAGLLLSTGNAGGVELLIDGTAAPPLRGAGTIRDSVSLDPYLVLAGRPNQTARPKHIPASQ
jgi:hypothetical protein